MGGGSGESEEGARKVTKMRKGLTLMELLTVISILATLAALLFPVYLKVRSRVYEVRCADQLRQIGLAIRMYCQDFGDGSPYAMSSRFLPEALYPHYLHSREVLICPRVIALTPSNILERFRRKGRTTNYWFVSPLGLDDLKWRWGELIGFSDVFAKRGEETPIGYCDAHRKCPLNIGDTFYEVCGDYGFRLCNEIFVTPYSPIIVLRWGGQVSFVYKGSLIDVDTIEFLVDY
jgi:prepilin-type N-terminal cleavage/methylation domain-containing protein